MPPKDDIYVLIVDSECSQAVIDRVAEAVACSGGQMMQVNSPTAYYPYHTLYPSGHLLPVSSNFFFERPTRPNTIEQIIQVVRMGQRLKDEEARALYLYNFVPTLKGLKTCERRHTSRSRLINQTPGVPARFDRRIPCWRVGRWKSLT